MSRTYEKSPAPSDLWPDWAIELVKTEFDLGRSMSEMAASLKARGLKKSRESVISKTARMGLKREAAALTQMRGLPPIKARVHPPALTPLPGRVDFVPRPPSAERAGLAQARLEAAEVKAVQVEPEGAGLPLEDLARGVCRGVTGHDHRGTLYCAAPAEFIGRGRYYCRPCQAAMLVKAKPTAKVMSEPSLPRGLRRRGHYRA